MLLNYSVSQILETIGSDYTLEGEFIGDIRGIASLSEALEGDLSFLGNKKYTADVPKSDASVLLLPQAYKGVPKENQLWIRVANPSYALALICAEVEKRLSPKPKPGIHPSAVIEPTAVISPEATIGALCYVGAGARVGASELKSRVSIGRDAIISDGCLLFEGVVISDYSKIGIRNRISAGAVIGADGYGYEYRDGVHQRVPQIGYVETEEDVDIGTNTTIDRARFGVTKIGRGTKIDNLVQIGHNVQIGQNCLIVSQVGISGSSVLEDGVIVAGQTGIAGHLRVGAGAILTGRSGVTKSVEAGAKVGGHPVESFMLQQKISILKRQLPELFKRVDSLEEYVEVLKSSDGGS